MSEPHDQERDPGLSLSELCIILSRHKFKLLVCTVTGLITAAIVYLLNCDVYESRAKLLVRYVLDKSAVDALESQPDKSLGSPSASLINSEVEILSSWDLAEKVVDAMTLERLRTGGVVTREDAARTLLRDLKVTPPNDSNVIMISYKNQDPDLAKSILEKWVTLYFEKHLDVHRSAGAFEFVSRETDQVRTRLDQTEKESRTLKAKAGIISLAGGTASLDAELARSQYALRAAEVERAEQGARITEIEKTFVKGGGNSGQLKVPVRNANDQGVQRYQALVIRLAQLRQGELELLARFTPENRVVKIHQAQVAQLQHTVRELEQANPEIAEIVPFTGSNPNNQQPNLAFERARFAGIQAKTEMLQAQFSKLKEQAETLSEMGPRIAELDRKKEIDEASYKHFGSSLERARIDEALDPSKMPNISVVQKPSPALQATEKLKKVVAGLASGGVLMGVFLAMFIDLVLDKTVKRPLELETRLKIPLLLAIPYFKNKSIQAIDHTASWEMQEVRRDGSGRRIEPWESDHFIRSFAEAIRDRVILFFELNRMRQKPKLIGVTGCAHGAGASTLASGLAAAFSETGDGKVLLVDMNARKDAVHPFFSGTPVCSLADALEGSGSNAPSEGNVYVANAVPNGENTQIIPKRFYELIPRLKASEYDYIVFDMPPMEQTSSTLTMAGFMDSVVLVIEAEASDRDAVKRAYADLSAVKANVSVVFNKSRA